MCFVMVLRGEECATVVSSPKSCVTTLLTPGFYSSAWIAAAGIGIKGRAACTCSNTLSHTHTHTHALSHTHTHTHTHTLTYAHVRTLSLSQAFKGSQSAQTGKGGKRASLCRVRQASNEPEPDDRSNSLATLGSAFGSLKKALLIHRGFKHKF